MANPNTKRTATALFIASAMMFGFGYVLVPLYNVFCDITGFNGRTKDATVAEAALIEVDENRLVSVEFDTNVRDGLPWLFEANRFDMSVHPGEMAEALFTLENKSDRTITGKGVPSVAPRQASLFFNKTECFCYEQQTLAPGEQLQVRVRFFVDPRLPVDINVLTLSYTFFKIQGSADA